MFPYRCTRRIQLPLTRPIEVLIVALSNATAIPAQNSRVLLSK
jgi:hypothetical protein